MKLGITALALLAFTSNVSAIEIVPFSNITSNTSQNTVNDIHKDCMSMPTTNEDEFLRLIMDTRIDPKAAASNAALYAASNHRLFNGNQLYLFANMLLAANEHYSANVLLERIIERDANNSTPDLLIKVADRLKQKNPILAAKAYSYAKMHPQATLDEKTRAEDEYKMLENIALFLNSL